MVDGAGPLPFPPRSAPTVRIGSPEEGEAFLAAYPPADGPWTTVSTLRVAAGDRTEDHVTLRSAGGRARTTLRFDVSAFAADQSQPPAVLDNLLQRAAAFARENGPHHPGELPRFPVPSTGYEGRVEVPMAILAVDRGRRGLYAPARVVVLDFPDGAAVGVGEVPGFDPEDWPPPRLGDWPPEGLGDLDPERLRGTVTRFGACWLRLLGAWFGADYSERADEAAEVHALIARLDPPGMPAVYARLSREFWRWLAAEDAPRP